MLLWQSVHLDPNPHMQIPPKMKWRYLAYSAGRGRGVPELHILDVTALFEGMLCGCVDDAICYVVTPSKRGLFIGSFVLFVKGLSPQHRLCGVV